MNFLVQNVYAVEQVVTDPLNGSFGTIADIAGWAINVILGIGWALTFVMLAAGFIKYILSKGETKATDAARQWLSYAALGGVGLFFLTVFKSIIMNLLGLTQDAVPGGDSQFNPFES